MADINKQSDQFIDFLLAALDHGIDSIEDNGGPLIPFVITQFDEQKELKRCLTDTIEEGQVMAEQILKTMDPKPDFGVIVFDGFVHMNGEKIDAIIARAFDKTQDEGFMFAACYTLNEGGESITRIEQPPAFIGKEDNILYSVTELTQKKKPFWKVW